MHISDDDRHQLSQEERVNRIYEYGQMAAFPSGSSDVGDGDTDTFHFGLTKREYFAITALAGFIEHNIRLLKKPEDAAKEAVAYAEALLEALNK